MTTPCATIPRNSHQDDDSSDRCCSSYHDLSTTKITSAPSESRSLLLSAFMWTLFLSTLVAVDVRLVQRNRTHGTGAAEVNVNSSHRRRHLLESTNSNPNVEFDANDPHVALLQVSSYTVIGPTSFPEPTAYVQRALELKRERERAAEESNNLSELEVENSAKARQMAQIRRHQQQQINARKEAPPKIVVKPRLKPSLGHHRPDQDAIFVFASEYDLSIYQGFILSLRKTGYRGDVVLAVSPLDMVDPNSQQQKAPPTVRQQQVHDFFASDPFVVIYVVPFVCFNAEGEVVDSAKGGIRVCKCNELYGQERGEELLPIEDTRIARPVATTRYELYWIWSLNYHKHSWLFLVDARDTYFQLDPFGGVPRDNNPKRDSGVLFFFGENSDATRIGKSEKNRKWLNNAYGNIVVEALEDKPTICSGATMGEQIALETYLRAMVNEFDETEIQLMGADQGFHNYLYYSNKLQHAKRIRSITVFDQGRGAVNNMGAMRTQELNTWGNGKLATLDSKTQEYTVYNWDGTVSPVVHQFDRFKPLSEFVYKRKTLELARDWKQAQTKFR